MAILKLKQRDRNNKVREVGSIEIKTKQKIARIFAFSAT